MVQETTSESLRLRSSKRRRLDTSQRHEKDASTGSESNVHAQSIKRSTAQSRLDALGPLDKSPPPQVPTDATDESGNLVDYAKLPVKRKRGRPRKTESLKDSPVKKESDRVVKPSAQVKHMTLCDTPRGESDPSLARTTSEKKRAPNKAARTKADSIAKVKSPVRDEEPRPRQFWPSGKPKGRPRKSDAIAKPYAHDKITSSSVVSSTSKAPVLRTNRTPRRFKLTFDRSNPKPVITNPMHILIAPRFTSLKLFLNSFVSLEEDMTKEQARQIASKRREIRQRTALAAAELERSPIPLQVSLPSRTFDPPNSIRDHQSAFCSQACHFSKLLSEERKRNVALAKKIAVMINAHFKQAVMLDHNIQAEHQKLMRRLAREVAKLIQGYWKIARKEWHRREVTAQEELQRAAGKLQLRSMLEQSDSLLKARTTMEATSSASSEYDSDANEDHFLSVDQLRHKYSQILDVDEDAIPEIEASISATSSSSNPERENPTLASPSGTCDSMSTSDSPMDSEDESSIQSCESGPGLSFLYPELQSQVGSHGMLSEDQNSLPSRALSDHEAIELLKNSEPPVDLDSEHSIGTNGPDTRTRRASKTQFQSSLPSDISLSDDADDEPMDSELDTDTGSDSDAQSEGPGLSWLYTHDLAANSTAQEREQIVANVAILPNNESNSNSNQSSLVHIPHLLRGTLREYQHQGLDWLSRMYAQGTNGILADEMGLGKTIQTISLLAWLACEQSIWGPHLIIVPTSVMLNWETEFKKFVPGLKVLTYYGSLKERKEKRRGWTRSDFADVVITSYQLVMHDSQAFRRKHWMYMILDEAHNIKNFKSQRWQTLLNFNADHRLLLTGTPLQNNLNELWSLLYFLMPQGQFGSAAFANLTDFQDWFSKPIDHLVETGGRSFNDEARTIVGKLHHVLRPYILRRLKADVEKQMPSKYEHVITCRLSKRQRQLYDDYMTRSNTQQSLASGNFLSVINCFMQLRKVCNHPDLFETRPIVTSLAIRETVLKAYQERNAFSMAFIHATTTKSRNGLILFEHHSATKLFDNGCSIDLVSQSCNLHPSERNFFDLNEEGNYLAAREGYDSKLFPISPRNAQSHLRPCIFPASGLVTSYTAVLVNSSVKHYSHHVRELLEPTIEHTTARLQSMLKSFICLTPKISTPHIRELFPNLCTKLEEAFVALPDSSFYARTSATIAFPDKRLLQYDCGKLQRLHTLLRSLIAEGHRVLIFTQMTKMLDILEQFLNIHGYRYFRLDGATKIEARQTLTERFNNDPRIPVFILSTRSGGLGINLTGADCVIFYDSDWNPSMDRQCQDRAHRIGQTRDVHIYRFVSESTIEQNIMRKADQKRLLDDVVIGEGEFTTNFFDKIDWQDMFTLNTETDVARPQGMDLETALAQVEDVEDAQAAKGASKELAQDEIEFQETEAAAETVVEAPMQETSEEPGSVEEYMIRFLSFESKLV